MLGKKGPSAEPKKQPATFIYFATAEEDPKGLGSFASVSLLHTKSCAQNFNLQLNAAHKQLCIKMPTRGENT